MKFPLHGRLRFRPALSGSSAGRMARRGGRISRLPWSASQFWLVPGGPKLALSPDRTTERGSGPTAKKPASRSPAGSWQSSRPSCGGVAALVAAARPARPWCHGDVSRFDRGPAPGATGSKTRWPRSRAASQLRGGIPRL